MICEHAEELREAWAETKANGGKYMLIVKRDMWGQARSAILRWQPFRKRWLWSYYVNEWRDEMEDRYGEEL